MPSFRRPNSRPVAALAALLLALLPVPAPAQCNPIFEAGGQPGPVCRAGFPYLAVGRGGFVSIEHVPNPGTPSVVARVRLDKAVAQLESEAYGRVWATDGPTLYAIDTTSPASPQVLSRWSLPGQEILTRLRVKGNLVYAMGGFDSWKLYIFDATNPAAPILRSTLGILDAELRDLEVRGTFVYLPIADFTPAQASLLVIDAANPAQPAEVRRVGHFNRSGLRIAIGGSTLYQTVGGSFSGRAIEAWSLADPANPSFITDSTPISFNPSVDDELRFMTTSGAFPQSVLAHLDAAARGVRTYNPSTVAQSAGFSLHAAVRGLCLEAPSQFRFDAYITRSSGELARIVGVTGSNPAVDERYFEVRPGLTTGVAAGAGFAVLADTQASFSNALSFFTTPQGGADPALLAVMRPDPGYAWSPDNPGAIDDLVFAVESAGGSPWVIVYRVTTSPPGVQFVHAFQLPAGVRGLAPGYDSANHRWLCTLTSDQQLTVFDATDPAAITPVGSIATPSDVFGPVRFIPGLPPVAPSRVLIGGTSRTQIIAVNTAGQPSPEGFIPFHANLIIGAGASPTDVWITDSYTLRCYDITNPEAPVERSSLTIGSGGNYITDGVVTTSGTRLHATTALGDLVEVNIANPAAPAIVRWRRIASGDRAYGIAADPQGRLHIANGIGGYALIQDCPCYPNCDASTQPPVLNVADFTCFLQKFAAGDAYANCDASTQPPTLNVADFTCFLQRFAAGCP